MSLYRIDKLHRICCWCIFHSLNFKATLAHLYLNWNGNQISRQLINPLIQCDERKTLLTAGEFWVLGKLLLKEATLKPCNSIPHLECLYSMADFVFLLVAYRSIRLERTVQGWFGATATELFRFFFQFYFWLTCLTIIIIESL